MRHRTTGRTRHAFRLGAAVVYPDRHSIERDGRLIALQPKVVQVLEELAAAAGSTVMRDDLLDAVWGAHGSAELLNNAIWKLRRALGDGPESRIIETVPRLGYRLTRRPEPAEAPGHGWKRPGALVAAALIVVLAATAGPWRSPAESAMPTIGSTERLVPMAGVLSGPAFSPDGRQVAYVAPDGSYHTDLFLYDRAAGEARRLTDDPAWNFRPAFSTGGLLAVFRYLDGGCSIEVFAGSSGTRLAGVACDNVDGRGLAWSSDDELLVSEGGSLLAIDWATGVRRPVLPDDERWLLAPVQAPDGQQLAAIERHDTGERVVVAGAKTAVGPTHDHIGGLTWLGSGKLAFAASRGAGDHELWRWQVNDPAGPVRIGRVPGENQRLSFDARSGVLAFDALRDRTDLLLAGDAPNTAAKRLATTAAREYAPAVSPDGRRLAWLNDRPAPGSLWVRELPAGQAQHLAFVDAVVEGLAWVGNGRLVGTVRTEGRTDLVLIAPDTGAVEPLVEEPARRLGPTATPDGRHVFFSERNDDGWLAVRLDLASGSRDPFRRPGLQRVVPAHDGAGFYFTRRDESGIWYSRLGSDAVERVAPGVAKRDWGNWGLAGDGAIVRLERFDGGNRLWRHDLDRGTVSQLGFLQGNVLPGANLAVDQAGQVIVATEDGYEGELLALSIHR
ncbi:MAG: winged helix-turn-helix domain-containing protein [Pseudomonadota bacterium]